MPSLQHEAEVSSLSLVGRVLSRSKLVHRTVLEVCADVIPSILLQGLKQTPQAPNKCRVLLTEEMGGDWGGRGQVSLSLA